MAQTAAKARKPAKRGTPPRVAPPVPALSEITSFRAAAEELGLELMPWQDLAARYITAVTEKRDPRWKYREVCIVVARQNGKTSLLKPLILQRLRAGIKLLHTAQNRTLPRETFLEVAADLAEDPDVLDIRQANGQETIKMANGGRYSLVAPRPGVRGHGVDVVILDEVREQHTFELMQAIKPTITASRNPQILYLSNAGDVTSVVLNDLKRRAEADDSLAYIEWSARPDRAIDDQVGWREANPALGITIQLDTLRDLFRSSKAAAFETEHLCRWVRSMRPRLVSEEGWERARTEDLQDGVRPFMGIGVGGGSQRASVALAWPQADGSIALDLVEDIADDLDLDKLGPALNERAIRSGVVGIGFGSWTDAGLARHLGKNAKAIDGKEWANASVNFARLVESGFLQWRGADTITSDLLWLARKPHESGAWSAVVVDEEHPATAALAAIRAVWLASGPKAEAPRVF
jgi:signal recognition particle subunit SEC65